MEENFRGAESKLYINEWLGKTALYKIRLPKTYRIPELDYTFRKKRTIHEAKLLSKAKAAGVRTPFVFEIDIENTTLVIEYIEGEILKNYIQKINEKEQFEIVKNMGNKVGRLHKAGIVHGDLTTSNIIIEKNEKELVFVDFGLGYISDRLEDFGIDLYLLERAFVSTHPDLYEKLWSILLEGYKEISPFKEEIEEKIKEISSRGRYSERV